MPLDKNADLDMNKSRQTNGSSDNDKAAAAAPMSQISGVRRLQQSNSVVGIVPRFGVELPNEQPLAEVSHCCTLPYLQWLMVKVHVMELHLTATWCHLPYGMTVFPATRHK